MFKSMPLKTAENEECIYIGAFTVNGKEPVSMVAKSLSRIDANAKDIPILFWKE